MATPTRIAVITLGEPANNPLNPATYVSARVLAAGTPESITVPANGKLVRLIATADFWYSTTGTASPPAADVDDGTASELVNVSSGDGRWLYLTSSTAAISVVSSASAAAVVASFYDL